MWTLKAMRVASLLGSLYTTAFELEIILGSLSVDAC